MGSQMFSSSLLDFRSIDQVSIWTNNNSSMVVHVSWANSYSCQWVDMVVVDLLRSSNFCSVDIDGSVNVMTGSGSYFSMFGKVEGLGSLDFWGFYWYSVVVDDWNVLGVSKDSSATSVVDETMRASSSFSMGSKMGSFGVLNL